MNTPYQFYHMVPKNEKSNEAYINGLSNKRGRTADGEEYILQPIKASHPMLDMVMHTAYSMGMQSFY